jgi:hypothetical protein
VEEYTTKFKSLQYDVSMHGGYYDPLFFATQYVRGLRDDIRAMVEPQVSTTVERATIIARIQQKMVDRQKLKYQTRNAQAKALPAKQEAKPATHYGNLWRDKQLRDYRKANNLCYHCGEKYEPGHAETCAKRNKPHVNALSLNDLDREISEDLLNEMAIDIALTETFGHLSHNALSGTHSYDSIQLKATVKNKTMLILVDTGSSHCFVSSHFVQLTKLPTTTIAPQKVKLANGQWMTTTQQVKGLEWYIQGQTFNTDMIVLDLLPYDAILGYDWLKSYSPMQCDWQAKTMQFQHRNKEVILRGSQPMPLDLNTISAKQVYKSTHGNDIWAFVIVKPTVVAHATQPSECTKEEDIQLLLQQYANIFQEPTGLPPHRSYDHAISLFPDAVPVNARPYHYSPQHKTEIEKQVKELLAAGLVSQSHSPFASPVLLVKKKDSTWRFCIDYKILNAITVKNRFPLPIVEEILDELAGSKFFYKIRHEVWVPSD